MTSAKTTKADAATAAGKHTLKAKHIKSRIANWLCAGKKGRVLGGFGNGNGKLNAFCVHNTCQRVAFYDNTRQPNIFAMALMLLLSPLSCCNNNTSFIFITQITRNRITSVKGAPLRGVSGPRFC